MIEKNVRVLLNNGKIVVGLYKKTFLKESLFYKPIIDLYVTRHKFLWFISYYGKSYEIEGFSDLYACNIDVGDIFKIKNFVKISCKLKLLA